MSDTVCPECYMGNPPADHSCELIGPARTAKAPTNQQPGQAELEQLRELDANVLARPDVELDGGRYLIYPRTLLAIILAERTKAEQAGYERALWVALPYKDENPTEDGVPVETYGYEVEYNQAINDYKAAIAALRPPQSGEKL